MRHVDEIAARAESLWERLRRPPPLRHDAALGAERLERWTRTAAGGDAKLFARRLRWAGWRRAEVLRVLGSKGEPAADPPHWTGTLVAMGEAARSASGRPLARGEVPFEPLLLPMVDLGLARLAGEPGVRLLEDAARSSLSRELLGRLSRIAAPSLYAEFARTLPDGPDLFSVLIGPPRDRSTRLFDAFVASQLEDGCGALFRTYPVLARLIATAIDDWVEAASEFLRRFAADGKRIGGGTIASLNAGLSEPHNRGRSVVAIRTDTGRRFVYKPRSVDGEAALARAADWCNRHASSGWLPMPAAAVHPGDGYGWVEFVEAAECRDPEEAGRAFERIGQLLGLLHALQSTDVNSENLIVDGEQPFLVDAETLLQSDSLPMESWFRGADAWSFGSREIGRSVVRAGLLPVWQAHPVEGAFDVNGLAHGEADRFPIRTPRFHHVNTDSMVLVNEFGKIPSGANIVRIGGRPLCPSDFARPILAGFERACRLLQGRGEELLDSLRATGSARDLRLRHVHRATRAYVMVLLAARSPEWLGDGVDFSIQLDRFSRPLLDASARPPAFEALGPELESLERGDIPYFTVESNSGDGDCGGRRIAGFLDEPPLGRARRGLKQLGETGWANQRIVVRGVLEAHGAHVVAGDELMPAGAGELGVATKTEFLEAAQSIASDLRRAAFRGRSRRNPHAIWLGASPVGDSGRWSYGILGEDLYGGRTGVALFLAALGRVTGTTEDEPLVEAALSFVRRGWRRRSDGWREALIRTSGNGATSGLSSVVYAALRAGTLLRRSDLVEDAAALAALLESEVLFARPVFDLSTGHAGAILVLLRLVEETGDRGPTRTAVRLGEALLSGRVMGESGRRAWPFQGTCLAGMAHGAAGIAYALLRLFQATSDERFLSAAREATAHEDTLFDQESGNWRDLRKRPARTPVQPFMTSWCHGAAGIGLARIAGLAIDGDAARRADVEVAVRTTAAHSLDDADSLCCGNMGRLELLWIAASRLGRTDLGDLCLLKASEILARSRAAGGFRLSAGRLSPWAAPSLFKGAAGVGYQLLRLVDPVAVPSVLLFE